jgi:hypothetical protein
MSSNHDDNNNNNNNNNNNGGAPEVETFSFPDLTVHVSVMMPEAVPNTPELAAAHRRVRQSIVATVMQHLTNARSVRLPIGAAPEPIVASLPIPAQDEPAPPVNSNSNSNSNSNGRPWQGMPLMPLVVSLLNALSAAPQQPQQHDNNNAHEYSFGDFSNILNALFLRARPRPQPASEAAISSLHRGPLSSELLALALECAICKEEFAAADIGVTLPCNAMHVFHEPCLLPWLREHHHTCPLCRHKLPNADDLAAAATASPPVSVQHDGAVSIVDANANAAATAIVADGAAALATPRRSRRSRRTAVAAASPVVDNDAAAASSTAAASSSSSGSSSVQQVGDEPKRTAAGEHVDDVKRSKRRRRT